MQEIQILTISWLNKNDDAEFFATEGQSLDFSFPLKA